MWLPPLLHEDGGKELWEGYDFRSSYGIVACHLGCIVLMWCCWYVHDGGVRGQNQSFCGSLQDQAGQWLGGPCYLVHHSREQLFGH